MAYIGLDDLVLEKEYCNKPKHIKCTSPFCYDEDYYTCKYWKQEFITLREKLQKQKAGKQ